VWRDTRKKRKEKKTQAAAAALDVISHAVSVSISHPDMVLELCSPSDHHRSERLQPTSAAAAVAAVVAAMKTVIS